MSCRATHAQLREKALQENRRHASASATAYTCFLFAAFIQVKEPSVRPHRRQLAARRGLFAEQKEGSSLCFAERLNLRPSIYFRRAAYICTMKMILDPDASDDSIHGWFHEVYLYRSGSRPRFSRHRPNWSFPRAELWVADDRTWTGDGMMLNSPSEMSPMSPSFYCQKLLAKQMARRGVEHVCFHAL